MADPLPDPRVDMTSDVEYSSEEEVDDLFAVKLKEINITKIDTKDDSNEESNYESNYESSDDFSDTTDSKSETRKSQSKESNNHTERSSEKRGNYFVCKICLPIRKFTKQKVFDEHNQLVHDEGPKEVCMWCAKPFFNQIQLKVHQTLYFHDKPLK